MTEALRAEINRGNWHKLRDTAEPSTLLALIMHFMHFIDRNSLFPTSPHAKALCDALHHLVDANQDGYLFRSKTDAEDKVERPAVLGDQYFQIN